MRLIVLGAGALGGRVARRWPGEVVAVTRTPRRHEALRADGILPTLEIPDLTGAHVLVATNGSANQREVCARLTGVPARAVLTSSSAFHRGQRGVVRPSDPQGTGPRAEAAAAAEEAFLAWAGDSGVRLRFGGLYAEGRGPTSVLLRRGHAPEGPPDRPLSLIHYDDAATACLSALTHPESDPVYLVTMPPLPTRQQFYEAACAAHGLPAPTFSAPEGVRLSYDTSAAQRDLLPQPAFPDWRAALR